MVGRMSILNQRPERRLLEEVALLKGIDVSFVEKDWFVVQLIGVIGDMQIDGFDIIFSGGTCLSKAHALLQRFSEDIDFRVVSSAAAQPRKARSNFKKAVVDALSARGFVIEPGHLKARDENRFFSIEVEYESYFPPAVSLRPHVLIEITFKETQLSSMDLSVSSFVSELTHQVPEVTSIGCLDPVESAADKLSAIAWRIPDRVREGENDDPSLVRHLHDLAILQAKALAQADFAALVKVSMGQDENRAKTAALADLSVTEKFQLMLTILENDPGYPREYDRFVQGVSYATDGSTPDFKTALQAVRNLVERVGRHPEFGD